MAGTITIYKGTDYQNTITITDSAGAAVNLTGATVKFKISKEGDTDAAAMYFISSASATHLTISTPASGICTLVIPDSTTKLFSEGTYKWQLRYITTDPYVNDSDKGTCIIDGSLFDAET